MQDQKKAKWLLGGSGVILSALLLTQFTDGTSTETSTADTAVMNTAYSQEEVEQMSTREQELVSLDWSNFEIVATAQQQPVQQAQPLERKTRRS